MQQQNLGNNRSTFLSNASPLSVTNQQLAINANTQVMVGWQQASNPDGSNNNLETSNPINLASPTRQITTLPSGEISNILMDGTGNAWVFVQNSNDLAEYLHNATDPVNIWIKHKRYIRCCPVLNRYKFERLCCFWLHRH